MPSAQKGRQERAMPQYEIRIISRGSEMKKIGVRAFMDFINSFVEEKAYLSVQKKVTLSEEKKWMMKCADALDRKEQLRLILFIDGKMAGMCDMMRWTLACEKNNIIFGLLVSKKWRGYGFGELLLRKGILLGKRKLRPHKMWIEHFGSNKVAKRLYRKLGFVTVGRLRGYDRHYGKYEDKIIMEFYPKPRRRLG